MKCLQWHFRCGVLQMWGAATVKILLSTAEQLINDWKRRLVFTVRRTGRLWILLLRHATYSAAYAAVRCLSVRPSVTFVYCNGILKLFQPLVAPPFQFSQTLWQYSEEDLAKAGVECKWDMKKLGIFDQYLASPLKLKWYR